MSESEPTTDKIIMANPSRFISGPNPELRKKQHQKRQTRLAESAPYYKLPSKATKKLSNAREVEDFKSTLDITPSKPVPNVGENIFLDTPSELRRSEMREEVVTSQPTALNFNDEYDMGFDLNEQIEEKGGRSGRKRRKSRKLRKSSKKSRKSRRRKTRKVRRH